MLSSAIRRGSNVLRNIPRARNRATKQRRRVTFAANEPTGKRRTPIAGTRAGTERWDSNADTTAGGRYRRVRAGVAFLRGRVVHKEKVPCTYTVHRHDMRLATISWRGPEARNTDRPAARPRGSRIDARPGATRTQRPRSASHVTLEKPRREHMAHRGIMADRGEKATGD